jgi:formyltetrahydrofolate hydrolase
VLVKDVGRLLLPCADRPGLVAAGSAFLAGAGANIVSLNQHSTEQSGGTVHATHHLPSARSDGRTVVRAARAASASIQNVSY